MQRSTERILTTHAGRLPNPDNIAAILQARADGDQATFDRLMQAGVADRVRQQMALRNDIHSDGEFWKARDAQYYNSRVTGVDNAAAPTRRGAFHPGAPARTAYAGVSESFMQSTTSLATFHDQASSTRQRRTGR